MDDSIFDDVDAILSEDVSSEEDKSFSEDELQDIMSEIENLEKEFEGAQPTMSLQDQIDAELAEINSANVPTPGMDEVVEMPEDEVIMTKMVVEEVIPTPTPTPTPAPIQITSFAKAPVVAEIPKHENKSEVTFQASGQMNFNLDFKIGADVAKLSVDPVKGLMVTVAGVEFCINEDSGCTVSMENGMKFTIPLSSQTNSSKKKVA
ncbi:MAG: hypothetical protein K2Q18_08225 [Bdellovibrionales bacterium]|nr:hypothetical protein [Bdellovibrionales bacterium]